MLFFFRLTDVVVKLMKLDIRIDQSTDMNDSSEILNPSISDIGAFFCWKSESEEFILTSQSNEIYNHVIIPVHQHTILSEAITVLQSSFPKESIQVSKLRYGFIPHVCYIVCY